MKIFLNFSEETAGRGGEGTETSCSRLRRVRDQNPPFSAYFRSRPGPVCSQSLNRPILIVQASSPLMPPPPVAPPLPNHSHFLPPPDVPPPFPMPMPFIAPAPAPIAMPSPPPPPPMPAVFNLPYAYEPIPASLWSHNAKKISLFTFKKTRHGKRRFIAPPHLPSHLKGLIWGWIFQFWA